MDKDKRIGTYIESSVVGGESFKAYLPKPLPPEPPLDMSSLYPLLDKASTALGRLDGLSIVLPSTSLFLYMYVRKEALLSSQIEGTQSSLSDLLLFEIDETPGALIDDVTEVSCYVAAMNYGLERLRELPLSLRLIKEIHAKLMNNARGGRKMPGEFRQSQNWIGGARPGNAIFVPPPHEKLMECMGDLENFLHDEKPLPALIKAGLAHVQFETLHPFLDGNGRLGRLLITLILCAEGVLKQPLLYLSLYFKANRATYYNHLQSVRETGDWESWLAFFLTGVINTADQAIDTAQTILALFDHDHQKIEASNKSAAAVATVFRYMQSHPVTNTTSIKEHCNISLPTVLRSVQALEELGIIKEVTGKARHKIFVYTEYLELLKKGTEPLKY